MEKADTIAERLNKKQKTAIYTDKGVFARKDFTYGKSYPVTYEHIGARIIHRNIQNDKGELVGLSNTMLDRKDFKLID